MFKSSASANHWKAFYLAALPQVEKPQPLTAIRRLTAPELPPLDCFTKIARERGNLFILTVAPSKSELHLFHQPAIIGGNLSDSDSHCVALCGMDSTANTVEFEISTLLDVDIKTPTWQELGQAASDIEMFKELKSPTDAQVFDRFRGKNFAALPLTLAIAFLHSPKKDPTSIALSFFKAMSDTDIKLEESEEDDDASEKYCESFMHIIQFCWAAANKELPPVSYWICELDEAVEWNSFLHRNAILPRKVLPSHDTASLLVPPGSETIGVSHTTSLTSRAKGKVKLPVPSEKKPREVLRSFPDKFNG